MAKSPPDDETRNEAEILPFRTPSKPASPPAGRKPPAPADEDDIQPLSNRALLGIGLLILFLVVSGVWLMDTLRENGIREDCLMQGRKNCGPIPTPSRER